MARNVMVFTTLTNTVTEVILAFIAMSSAPLRKSTGATTPRTSWRRRPSSTICSKAKQRSHSSTTFQVKMETTSHRPQDCRFSQKSADPIAAKLTKKCGKSTWHSLRRKLFMERAKKAIWAAVMSYQTRQRAVATSRVSWGPSAASQQLHTNAPLHPLLPPPPPIVTLSQAKAWIRLFIKRFRACSWASSRNKRVPARSREMWATAAKGWRKHEVISATREFI